MILNHFSLGWCNSSEAIKHCYNKCVENGVKFVTGDMKGSFEQVCCEEDGKVVGIRTKDNLFHACDLLIMATGAWTPGLVDVGSRVIATAQTVVQFKLPDHLRDAYGNQPGVWCADLSTTGYYGFAPNEDGIIKVGHHSRGYLNLRDKDQISVPRTQVTNPNDTIPIKSLRGIRQFLGKFFPFTASLDILCARNCW